MYASVKEVEFVITKGSSYQNTVLFLITLNYFSLITRNKQVE
jgi:hypothetical protein